MHFLLTEKHITVFVMLVMEHMERQSKNRSIEVLQSYNASTSGESYNQ